MCRLHMQFCLVEVSATEFQFYGQICMHRVTTQENHGLTLSLQPYIVTYCREDQEQEIMVIKGPLISGNQKFVPLKVQDQFLVSIQYFIGSYRPSSVSFQSPVQVASTLQARVLRNPWEDHQNLIGVLSTWSTRYLCKAYGKCHARSSNSSELDANEKLAHRE